MGWVAVSLIQSSGSMQTNRINVTKTRNSYNTVILICSNKSQSLEFYRISSAIVTLLLSSRNFVDWGCQFRTRCFKSNLKYSVENRFPYVRTELYNDMFQLNSRHLNFSFTFVLQENNSSYSAKLSPSTLICSS